MRTLVAKAIWSLTALAVSYGAATASPLCKKGEFCIRREPSSHTCTVQAPTEQPTFGDEWKGPFATRGEATAKMCSIFEPASEDPAKCAAVRPADACKRPLLKLADGCQATATVNEDSIKRKDIGGGLCRWDMSFEITVFGCPQGSTSSGEVYFTLVLHDKDFNIVRDDKSDAWTKISGQKFRHLYHTQYPCDTYVLSVEKVEAKNCTCDRQSH